VVLGLIPARAGSKGLPGKNLRPLAGRPLIVRTAEVARASGVIDRLVLSTDSAEIADLARGAGIEVPFLRPPDLAADDTPMFPVVRHAIDRVLAGGSTPDVIVLLQPTSPLRRPEHVRRAVALLADAATDSVVTVTELPRALSPDYVMRIDGGVLRPFLPEGARVTRRQDARRAYSRDGTVYAFRRDTVERFGDIYGDRCLPLIVDSEESLSIDFQADWDRAERILAAWER